jgi:stage II sporulation protein E
MSEVYLDKKRKIPPQICSKAQNAGDKKVSEAIGSIALTLSGVSKAKRRDREERIKTVVDGIFCSECETCVGCTFPTEQLKKHLCKNIIKNKKICEFDFSDDFKEKCNRWKFIEEKTNEIIKENHYKTSLRIDTLAEDYMSMARILSFGEKCAENRCYRDVVTANKLKMALELKNIRTQRVEICGTRLPLVEIYGIPFKMPFPEKTIKAETERVLGSHVQQIFFEAEEKTAKIGFRAVCDLAVDFYKISIPKKGEIICGDSISAFESDDGFFYSVIGDGMGSGRDAAVCSRLGTTFLEKLISAGIDKACAVSMLGNVISSSEDEIFTTIDLLEVDLVRHKLTVIKAGAAPTWILRNKRVYSVSSRTLPCGILSGSNAEQTVIDCYSGDTVIMASDGGESAVIEALRGIVIENKTLSSKDLSFVLADVASKKYGRNDDVSFCVVNIL